jgi:hypothetical protein
VKLNLTRGALSFELSDLVSEMNEAQRTDLCRSLVAEDRLFMNVLEVIADGHYNRDDEDGEWWFNREKLAELRQKLLPLVDDAMRGLIAELVRQRKQSELDAERHRKWAYELYHAWPRDEWRARPVGPADFQHAPETTATEVAALLPGEGS